LVAHAGVVGVYRDPVAYPVATSAAVTVYRLLSKDTDVSLFRDARRFTGLNSASISGSGFHHTPQDRASFMDQGSPPMPGASALALGIREWHVCEPVLVARTCPL
jgi:hypothetical protein